MSKNSEPYDDEEYIAIVGMSLKAPMSDCLEEFWDNLIAGKELVRFFSKDELIENGIKSELIENNKYIPAKGVINGFEWFDPAFWGYSPKEAEYIDPQQRVFLELAYKALEDAHALVPDEEKRVGVFGGCSTNYYLLNNIVKNNPDIDFNTIYSHILGNDKDFLATRIAYKLNLKGPCINVQTACSTSLVAVHLASQSLLNFECDMALAGGVSILSSAVEGYLYKEGLIFSKDGHCRPFDADASGTLYSHGAGIVVLKRYSDALRDNDEIYAVILGSAVNNDGSDKIGYTAPSIDGQSEVIAMAMANAQVHPQQMEYIEAHGTGTELGDPIEMEALTNIYSHFTQEKQYCGIGSVKSNLGHTDVAAGVLGLIKVAMSLKTGIVPSTINYESINPKIPIENTPFYIADNTISLNNTSPHFMAVSSFGIGGTNAHMVLRNVISEYNPPQDISVPNEHYIFTLSAKSKLSLQAMANRYIDYLENNTEIPIADMCYTLAKARMQYAYRIAVAATDINNLCDILKSGKYNYNLPEENRLEIKQTLPDSVKPWINNFLSGFDVDWREIYENDNNYKKVKLPRYAFDRQYLYIQPQPKNEQTALPAKEKNFREWFYQYSWKQKNFSQNFNIDKNTCYLLFLDSIDCAKSFKILLDDLGIKNIAVSAGKSFKKISTTEYQIDFSDFEHYQNLFETVLKTDQPPFNIVHFSSLSLNLEANSIDKDIFMKSQVSGCFSLTNIIQALSHNQVSSDKTRMTVVTNNMHRVASSDSIDPNKATMMGPALSAVQEQLVFSIKIVDIEIEENKLMNSLNYILNETLARPSIHEKIIAYRGDIRWVRSYVKIDMAPKISEKSVANPEGIFVITGGLGNIGLMFASHVAKKGKSHVILIHRSKFPGAQEWDDIVLNQPDSRYVAKIKLLKAIEETGSTVTLLQADISDEQKIRTIISEIHSQYTHITGIIHAAGLVTQESMNLIGYMNTDNFMDHFTPKVFGAINLITQLHSSPLKCEFILFLSSLSSILGGIGYTAYISANAYLDALAETFAGQKKLRYVAVNLDGWNIGDGILTGAKQGLYIDPEEGMQALDIVLSELNNKNIIISTGSLDKRIDALELSSDQSIEVKSRKDNTLSIEDFVLKIFREALGTDTLCLDDDLFSMGADSLITIEPLLKISKEYKINLLPSVLIQHKTLRMLSDFIRSSTDTRSTLKETKQENVICVRKSETNLEPVFLFHAAGGDVLYYKDFIENLSEDRSVYCFASYLYNSDTADKELSINEMAKLYLQSIFQIQKNGPYILMGASLGGTLAYEVARLILEKGEEVKMLALFDTPFKISDPARLDERQLLLYFLENLELKDEIVNVEDMSTTALDSFIKEKSEKYAKFWGDSASTAKNFTHFFDMFKKHIQAMYEYTPQKINADMDILYFKALTRDQLNPRNPEEGWIEILGSQVKCHRVKGTHISMMLNPHVKQITTDINELLSGRL